MTSSYDALRTSAAYLDLSARGRIIVAGEDRARLLHAMSTNDVAHLPEGESMYAFFLNAQGRILADANILNRGDSLWLDTEPETAESLFAHLDKYIIADDVMLEDVRPQWLCYGIEGPSSAALEPPVGFTVPLAATGRVGKRLFLPAADRELFQHWAAEQNLLQANAEVARTVRIENKIPRYGEEFSDRYLVQETQQMTAVHFSKGCYLGQEIVERIRSRGQVHRLLTPIRASGEEPMSAGSKIVVGNKESGELVSAVYSPALAEIVGFAYLRGEALLPGATFEIVSDSITQQASVRL